MLKKVNDLIEEEKKSLAPYAVKSENTRAFAESEHEYRLPFQRDKDRIIHSRAFKRLEYKTQVFIYSEGDNYRNRLTHTLEVAGISRTIACSLGLNQHLAESISLAHDLGHTPFGHAGQEILSGLMKGYGGFEHNMQSLRIVEKLENRYAEFDGLNLCIETLKGIMKHGGDYDKSGIHFLRKEEGPSFEAQITDIADEIAYNNHDIEDGIERNLITLENLWEVNIWKRHYYPLSEKYFNKDKKLILRSAIRSILNEMVTDLLHTTELKIQLHKINSLEDAHNSWNRGIRIVSFSEGMESDVRELKKFLNQSLYKHPDVQKMSEKGQNIIEKLFHHFLSKPEAIPESYRIRIANEGIHRIVADYIAGMTDRYAIQKFDAL